MRPLVLTIALTSLAAASGCVNKYRRLYANAALNCGVMTPNDTEFVECMQLLYGCDCRRMTEEECGKAAARKMTKEEIVSVLKDPSTKDLRGLGCVRRETGRKLRPPPPN